MAIFTVTYSDPHGRRLRRRIRAETREAIRVQAQAERRIVLQVHPWHPDARDFRARLKTADLIALFSQLQALLGSGLPIVEAIQEIAEEPPSPEFGRMLLLVSEALQSGVAKGDVATAFALFPRSFSPYVLRALRSGQDSGDLESVCGELMQYFEDLDRDEKEVRRALLEPKLQLVASVLAVLLFATVVVPKFGDLYRDLNFPVPPITAAIIRCGEGLKTFGWGFVPLFAGLWGTSIWLRRQPRVNRLRDRVLATLPHTRRICGAVATARFSSNLRVLTASGTLLPDALRLSIGLTGNTFFDHAIRDALRLVTQGVPLWRALKETKRWDPVFVAAVRAGERAGGLEEQFRRMQRYFAAEARARIRALLATVQPLATAGMAILVLGVVLSLYYPMLRMIETLSQGKARQTQTVHGGASR